MFDNNNDYYYNRCFYDLNWHFIELGKKIFKSKKVIRIMTIIVCFIICAYISTATISVILFDMFIKDDVLTRCLTYHMLFGIFGFTLSLMIQEVWNTKDKSFIYAFTALIWALVVGFLTNGNRRK